MPQKLNKAGQMQDYIPAGNGDPSGEYGTSNGTNKNYTTSDKKSSKANVITENKSVVGGKEWLKNKIDETAKKKAELDEKNSTRNVYGTEEERDREGAKKLGVSLEEYKKLKEQHKKEMADIFEDKETKANIINDDLTGKSKAKEINDFSKMFDSDDLTITFENDKYKYAKSGVDGMKKNQFLETLGATVSNKKQREHLATRNDGKWTFNVKNNKTGETKAITLNNDELFSLWNKVKNKGDLEKKGNNYFSVSFQKERQERNKKDFED